MGVLIKLEPRTSLRDLEDLNRDCSFLDRFNETTNCDSPCPLVESRPVFRLPAIAGDVEGKLNDIDGLYLYS